MASERGKQLLEQINASSGTSAEMPRYKSHKTVWALKIKEVVDPTGPNEETTGSRIIIPADEGFGAFVVDRDYVHKHNPQAGGYYVVYDDGYKSWSPATAFENGYTPIRPLDINPGGNPGGGGH